MPAAVTEYGRMPYRPTRTAAMSMTSPMKPYVFVDMVFTPGYQYVIK